MRTRTRRERERVALAHLCIGHDRAHRRRDGAPLAARALGEHGAVERRVHVGRLVERVRVDAERKVHERVGKADWTRGVGGEP
eukprot:772484-Prymnesium_polylepis.2